MENNLIYFIGVRVTSEFRKMLQEIEDSGRCLDKSDVLRSAIRLLYDSEKKNKYRERV